MVLNGLEVVVVGREVVVVQSGACELMLNNNHEQPDISCPMQ